MATDAPQTDADIKRDLLATYAVLSGGFAENPMPSAAVRTERLSRLKHAVLDYKDRLINAANEDFGGRAEAETLIAEILPVLEGIHYTQRKVASWMRSSRRRVPIGLLGASARVIYQPLGVIGVVVPWNFPIYLSLSPVTGALAAGNTAMIKMSEHAPRVADLVQRMIDEAFAPDEVRVVTGGSDVASAFSGLAFDHLVFTGSTRVGRAVMRSAAENLTPVTLELGGKSPAIIHDSFPIAEAARRLAFGKGLNAGQVCIAPDYVLVPHGKVTPFAEAFSRAIRKLYPTMEANGDYTAIISDTHRARLIAALDDAKAKGATAIAVNPAQEPFARTRKLPMHILTGVTDEMLVMQQEIFGPLLPVIAYNTLEEAVAFVNARPRPLALYYFDWNRARADHVLSVTQSGGACINDTISQAAVDDMPFGGVGASGMGQYHGHEGFLTFSNAKGVVRKGRINPTAFVEAPWGNRLYKAYLALQFRRFRRDR